MPTILQGTCKLVMGNGLHYNLQGGGGASLYSRGFEVYHYIDSSFQTI